MALLSVSGWDVVNNAFIGMPPWWADSPIIAYGPLLLITLIFARHKFSPDEEARPKVQLAAVYARALYVITVVITYAVLTSFGPKEWHFIQ